MKVVRRLRRFVQLLLLIAAACALVAALLSGRSPPPPEYSPLTSTLECHSNTRTCLLRNVHSVNGELILYMGKDAFDCAAMGLDDALAMFTGIGWGTGYVRFLCENSVDHWKGDSLASLGTNDTNPDNHKRFAIPIRVLNANPPKKYDPSPIVIAEPTILYSVLWPNLFRTIYAAYAAWYSLLEYKIFFNDHHRVLLVDRTHGSNPYKFLQIIQSVTPTPVMTSSQLLKGPPHIFRALVVGLSRDALVAEIVLERGTEWRFTLRRRALHMFCKALKQGILNDGHFVKGLDIPGRESSDMEFASTVPSKAFWSSWIHKHKRAPRVTLVLREANMPRQILNPGELIAALSRLPIQLQVHQFRRLTLIEQVRIVDNTDIFITMHGAAMTHILFLKPGAYVIELFPYSFKKVIYENIASILGIQYLHWQNMKESQTKFNWPAVEQQRATNMTKERITKLPIDWYNMDSKNYWRNQDTVVAVEEITHLVDTVVKDRRIEGNTKYLMFMPWEQFNNQVVGFKSACAVAKILNRTLVLPHLGYKGPKRPLATNSTPLAPPNGEFKVADVVWHPFEYYFDLTNLSTTLPCSFITFSNFYSLYSKHGALPVIRYHHLADNKTSEHEFRAYYKQIARLEFKKVEWDNVYFQLSESDIRRVHSKDADTNVLALGSMFWYFDFGKDAVYPIKEYVDYMDVPMYQQISQSLVFSERVQKNVALYLEKQNLIDASVSNSNGAHEYVAIHVRRGDYEEKCRELPTSELSDRCFTTITHVQQVLHEQFTVGEMKNRVLYISTNAKDEEMAEIAKLLGNNWSQVLFQKDLTFGSRTDSMQENSLSAELLPEDGVDASMFDQLICAKSKHFVGNLYSSFTRHVIDMRTLASMKSTLF